MGCFRWRVSRHEKTSTMTRTLTCPESWPSYRCQDEEDPPDPPYLVDTYSSDKPNLRLWKKIRGKSTPQTPLLKELPTFGAPHFTSRGSEGNVGFTT